MTASAVFTDKDFERLLKVSELLDVAIILARGLASGEYEDALQTMLKQIHDAFSPLFFDLSERIGESEAANG